MVARRGLFFCASCIVLLALFAGCNEPRADGEAASEVVRRFFAALPAGDCRKLEPLLLVEEGRSCEAIAREYNEHGVRLLEVESVVKDGRNPDAMLVRTRLLQGGEPRRQSSLLRVERVGGSWRLKP